MTKNLLVELGLEEMPAYVVTPSMKQLRDKMAAFLTDNRLTFDKIEMFSTPRRLAVRVSNLSEKQTDLTEDFKGPSKKIALDADGNFTKAAQGFVRGKGLTVEDITFREVKGEEYVYVTKQEIGKPVEELIDGVADVLTSLSFPVNMHWGTNTFEYIRPVHTLTVLLDDESFLMNLFDIESGRTSRGHRFLGHEVKIQSADSYEEDLRKVFVITSPMERENMILDQIKEIEKMHNVRVEIDEDLLDEVLNLIEYPTAFIGGRFDERYLEVPEEVLVTSMKVNQRYFVVRNENGKLLPYFVSVRNGNAEHLENVVKGNQKVLVARLEDAEFFWREDQRLVISDLVDKLKNVTFHEKIGSLAEHMERTAKIAALLAEKAQLSKQEVKDVARAAAIYKFDLLTGMVDEFDELQGIMGEKYALLAGENTAVARAIREHYLPIASDGELPDTKVGAILAIADKMDTILSFFSVGLIPSGSNDPYALRRATQGVVRILDKFGWHIALDELVEELYALQFDSLTYSNKEQVLDFFRARIEKMMDSDVPKDIVAAVLNGSTFVVRDLVEVAALLAEKAQEDSFKSSVESLARVFNLAEKAEAVSVVDESLFENAEEKALHAAIEDLTLSDDLADNIEQLFALSPVIDAFFDNTMVMAEDEAIRANRLALLAALTTKAKKVAQFNQINTK
ncbi:Glycine--tRNA ligase beta subunit [Streptococcus constellatus]|uniref:Glycine--tRNA ligase beta subunit n=1 Tax=Streptococcus constellatus TaxID=76860 RepID=A0A564TSL0_STRCV|nr:glycine--tRNA ligase subunit beta [Streptococcus constellatus]VUW99969.1 Glycine--tRNA ligase beta subunit [Streptococcus gordonii]VUX10172.1 Glycine--tRNA ligase beta subunit [Streptococcus constellatus]